MPELSGLSAAPIILLPDPLSKLTKSTWDAFVQTLTKRNSPTVYIEGVLLHLNSIFEQSTRKNYQNSGKLDILDQQQKRGICVMAPKEDVDPVDFPSPTGNYGQAHKYDDDADYLKHPATIKNVDDWLPVTGSRTAKWWYSTFHNITAMVGAGVLGLPAAMVFLGWGWGITVLVGSWLITLYTLWQMVEMHEMVPGKRLDRYHELGQEAFGPRLGLWIVIPQQLIVEVGVDIVYMVTGGSSLYKFYQLVRCPDQSSTRGCRHIGKTAFIVIFAMPHFMLSLLPNFNSIAGISLAAAVMSLAYSTVAWTDTVFKVHRQSTDYNGPPGATHADLVFGVFNALGTVAFAYAGHNVVLEIQATIPSTPERPSKIAMWRGVLVAYVVVAYCYFSVSIAGYWAFGNTINDNILIFLGKPRWLIAAANVMVVIHVTGSYQMYAMPVFDMMETVLVKKVRLPPSFALRLATRWTYVLITAFLGCTFPFFGDLLGFFGGFAFAPTTFFLPCIIWLILKKPRMFSLSWLINWLLIILGVALTVVATIGGLRNIIQDASKYRFYS